MERMWNGCVTDVERMCRTTQVRRKADVKDVNLLVDGKADVDEVNRALLDVNGQVCVTCM